MKRRSRFEASRKALIFWCLFIGIGAVAGAVGMLVDPSGKALGMDAMLPYFEVLPFSGVLFSDFTFSGIALLTVNGLTNLLAAVLLLKRKKAGLVLGGVFGVTLMLWICIQFYIFPFNFMSTAYFIFGLIQALTGYAAWVFYRQESFTVREEDYPNIGKNPKRLVVYFSRMGYTRKKAFEAANQSGAELYEIRARERTEGTSGFWWCGRFAMHGWAMPIEDVEVELEGYEQVTVCSPVWVFSLAAPMRSFCKAAAGRIKSADYILVHHMRARFEAVAREMDELLQLKNSGVKSYCCRKGRYL
ncbi:MAG: hypothetical protein Q4C01_06245 [Clostridia bacterium]|nr:hypothetical protein [Clostridia bacterium]